MRVEDVRRSNLRQAAINVVVAIGGVCLTFQYPVLCGVIMGVLLACALRTWNRRADVFLAAVAMPCGITLELAAAHAGLWTYAYSTIAGVPGWAFTLWPVFMIGLPRLAETAFPFDGGPVVQPLQSVRLAVLIIGVEIGLLVTMGIARPWLLTLMMLVLAALLYIAAPSRRAAAILAIGAFFGILGETLPVQFGIWTYPAGMVSGMPPWLAPGYAVFGLATVHLGIGLEAVITPEVMSRVRGSVFRPTTR